MWLVAIVLDNADLEDLDLLRKKQFMKLSTEIDLEHQRNVSNKCI